MTPKTTPEQWIEAAKWRDDGMTMAAIAAKLQVSKGRVSQKLGKKREKLVIEDRPFAT